MGVVFVKNNCHKSQSRGSTHVTCLTNLKIYHKLCYLYKADHCIMHATPIMNVNYLCRFNISPVDEYSSTHEKVQLSTQVQFSLLVSTLGSIEHTVPFSEKAKATRR